MELNKIEITLICLVIFVVGFLLGGIFIDVEESESFSDRVNPKKTCEENLFDCQVSLLEFVVDYNESMNYKIKPA